MLDQFSNNFKSYVIVSVDSWVMSEEWWNMISHGLPAIFLVWLNLIHNYTPAPQRGRGYTVLPLSVCPSVLPSVQDIFCRIFLSNCWWQKSDIWSQASYRYTILWVAFLDPSDSYFLFAAFFVTFFSATIDGRNLIFGHKLHIGTPYRGKRFWTHQIPTSCLSILLIFIHI